jgi:hypothetical protein
MRIRSTMALAFLMAGCPSETVGPPPAPPVNWQSLDGGARRSSVSIGPTENERAAAEKYSRTLAAPAFAGLAVQLDDDARFTFPGADDSRGREAIMRAHERLLGAFDERKIRTRRVWRTSSEQTVEWELTGVQARDWMGLKASQKSVTVKGVALLWTKDDGTITDLHLYFDLAAVKAQLDAAPATPGSVAGQAAAVTIAADGSRPPQIFDQGASPSERADLALAKASLDALEGNDLVAYLGTLADDVEIDTLERAQPYRGKGAATSYFKAMRKAIGQLDTTVTDAWGVGTFAVLEYTIAGEQIGPLGSIPAQRDKTVVLHIADIVEVAADKITHIWRYDNPAEIAVTPPS